MKWMTIVFAFSLTTAWANVHPKVQAALEGLFPPDAVVKAEHLILTSDQKRLVQNEARASVVTKVYRYYRIVRNRKTLGYGLLLTRRVRTKKATVLYLFDTSKRLLSTEIMAFGEPPEFKPQAAWMKQFSRRDAQAPLQLGNDIPTITGATLSARTVSDGARIARALLALIKH